VGHVSWFLQQGLLEKVFNRTLLLDCLCHLQVTLDSSFLVSQKRSTSNHTVTFLVVSFSLFHFCVLPLCLALGFTQHWDLALDVRGKGGGRLQQEQVVPAGKAKVIHLFVIKFGPPGGSLCTT
jgi:nitrate reductase NapE component